MRRQLLVVVQLLRGQRKNSCKRVLEGRGDIQSSEMKPVTTAKIRIISLSFLRMSFQALPTLQQLALQSLVKNESLAISAMQTMPMTFFPPLFKEACTQRRAKIIKALVADWPYHCLPAGLLMKNPSLETYQAILDGVDMWLQRRFRPRGKRLKVVDLRSVHHDLYDVPTGTESGHRSAEILPENQAVKGLSRYTQRRLLKVVIEIQLPQHEPQTQLLEWAEKRRNSLQLHCVKLTIGSLPFYKIRQVIKILKLEFVQELELNTVSNLSVLANLVPFISKMSNLQKIILSRVFQGRTITDREETYVPKILPLFSNLKHLKHLNIHDVYFLDDHMKQLLRYLKTSLESLSISLCKFSQSDLDSFAQWSHCQLKHLYLRAVNLSNLNFMPLKFFLERVANTLQILELEDCSMEDSDLRVLLPALIQCSQLNRINFLDNDFSTNVLEVLLYHTAHLSQLTKELYPAPKEVYNRFGYINVEEFSQRCAELKNTVMPVKDCKSVCFGSNACYDCGERYFYKLETTLCDCQP